MTFHALLLFVRSSHKRELNQTEPKVDTPQSNNQSVFEAVSSEQLSDVVLLITPMLLFSMWLPNTDLIPSE